MRRIRQTMGLCLAIVAVFLAREAGGAAATKEKLSPHAKTSAVVVDGSKIFIEYNRPSVRGRKIFGALIPWGAVWCPGADEVTFVSTTRPLKIGDKTLTEGKYSLWIRPTENEWAIFFNSDWDTFHNNHNARTDVARAPMEKQTLLERVEQLTFTIETSAHDKGGYIAMAWDTTKVSVPFRVE